MKEIKEPKIKSMKPDKLDNQNNLIITCPKCGAQYELCEIILPGELTGIPFVHGIIKDPLNKILAVDGKDEPVKTFHYTCDECGKSFVVEVSLATKVKDEPEECDFSEETVSIL